MTDHKKCDDCEQREQDIHVAAADQPEQHQRVDRPQQARPGLAGAVPPGQPDQPDGRRDKSDRIGEPDPENDPRHRRAAELGCYPLEGGRYRAVDGRQRPPVAKGANNPTGSPLLYNSAGVIT